MKVRPPSPSDAGLAPASYTGEINPRTQAITANVQVRFVPLDSDVSSTSFELNSALNVSRVVDDSGRQNIIWAYHGKIY